jgi:hypothetical protein
MKKIKPSLDAHQWPRKATPSIECRKRDLVIRISDWSRDREEPAYDVEIYIGGVYDWNESKSCTKHQRGTMKAAKQAAIAYAQTQIEKLL